MRLLSKTTKRTEEELRLRNEKRRARALTRWERLRAMQDEEYQTPRPERNDSEEEEELWSNSTSTTATTATTSRPSAKGKEKEHGSGSSSESSEESEERRRSKFAARRKLQKKKDRRSSHRRSDHHSSGSSTQRPTGTSRTPFGVATSGAKRLQQLEQANAMTRFFDALGGRES